MKSSKELVFDEIIKDPFISNGELVDRTGLSESLCKTIYRETIGDLTWNKL